MFDEISTPKRTGAIRSSNKAPALPGRPGIRPGQLRSKTPPPNSTYYGATAAENLHRAEKAEKNNRRRAIVDPDALTAGLEKLQNPEPNQPSTTESPYTLADEIPKSHDPEQSLNDPEYGEAEQVREEPVYAQVTSKANRVAMQVKNNPENQDPTYDSLGDTTQVKVKQGREKKSEYGSVNLDALKQASAGQEGETSHPPGIPSKPQSLQR